MEHGRAMIFLTGCLILGTVWSPRYDRIVLPLPPGCKSFESAQQNERGHVLATAYGPAGDRAFLWKNRRWIKLPSVKDAQPWLHAACLSDNDKAMIVSSGIG